MSTSLIYHTLGITGLQHQSFTFSEKSTVQHLFRKDFRCPHCYYPAVRTYIIRTRRIQGLPYGTKPVFFEVDIHRIYCPKCKSSTIEDLPFISHPKSRITKALEANCQIM